MNLKGRDFLKLLDCSTEEIMQMLELADKQDWTVLSTGGVLKKGALSLNGSSAEKMINSYHLINLLDVYVRMEQYVLYLALPGLLYLLWLKFVKM